MKFGVQKIYKDDNNILAPCLSTIQDGMLVEAVCSGVAAILQWSFGTLGTNVYHHHMTSYAKNDVI